MNTTESDFIQMIKLNRNKLKLIVLLIIIAIIVGYVSNAAWRTLKLYRYLKGDTSGWHGLIHQADSQLGIKAIPNSIGSMHLPMGYEFPVRYDSNGFRVPVEDSPSLQISRPKILALGCSWTYGAFCFAQQAFPFRLAERLDWEIVNAGFCSYGLAQMTMLARELIPRLSPDLVVVQYSSWLVDRAQKRYAPSLFGKVPVPYIIDSPEQEPVIAPPVFLTKAFSDDFSRFRKTYVCLSDFMIFARSAFPMFLREDANVVGVSSRDFVGLCPQPTRQRSKLIEDVYREIRSICNMTNSRLIVVVLGEDTRPVKEIDLIGKLDISVVNAHEILLAKLPIRSDEIFFRLYTNWGGNPPRFLDGHPNPIAHDIIAEAIESEVKRTK